MTLTWYVVVAGLVGAALVCGVLGFYEVGVFLAVAGAAVAAMAPDDTHVDARRRNRRDVNRRVDACRLTEYDTGGGGDGLTEVMR